MSLLSVLVTDTNIWIDLENGKILADVFRLPYQFVTTDFAVEEYIYPRWATLQDLGLQTHGLEPEYVLELVQLRQAHRQLSIIDLAGLFHDCLGYRKLIIRAGSCILIVIVALIAMVIMNFWMLKSHAESQK